MKKAILFVAALILLSFITNAKETDPLAPKKNAAKNGTCFDENSHLLNVGIGFGFSNYYKNSLSGSYQYGSSPVISVSYEQCWPKKLGPGYLGVGGYAGFRTMHSRYNDYNYLNEHYYYEHRWNYITVAARATYHWDVLNSKNAEVYGGALVGLRITTYHYSTNFTDPSANYKRSDAGVLPVASLFAGARWYFVPSVALFGEAGVGVSFLTGGVTFKW